MSFFQKNRNPWIQGISFDTHGKVTPVWCAGFCVCECFLCPKPSVLSEGHPTPTNDASFFSGVEPCCRAASVIPPGNSRCKIELIFGVMLQFNVVWCIRSRREIVLTIQSDNGKQGYKVGGKKYRRPKVVLPRGPCERYSSDWIRRRDQSWARSVGWSHMLNVTCRTVRILFPPRSHYEKFCYHYYWTASLPVPAGLFWCLHVDARSSLYMLGMGGGERAVRMAASVCPIFHFFLSQPISFIGLTLVHSSRCLSYVHSIHARCVIVLAVNLGSKIRCSSYMFWPV